VMRPPLLLLDEPTEGIQPSIIKDIGRAIAYLRNLGQIAVVLVEQYLNNAAWPFWGFPLFSRVVRGWEAACIAGRSRQGLGCDDDRGRNVGHAVADVARTFAANRAVGGIALAVRASAGATRRSRVREDGSLRVRCPGPASGELEAVIVNTAGGVAGGDRFTLAVTAEPRARLVVTTAAAEKVYRTLAPEAAIDVKLNVAAAASLAWLPQETILFDRARLKRTIDIDLAEDARLVLAEAIVFG